MAAPFSHLNFICLKKDTTCTQYMLTSYKTSPALKCIGCRDNTFYYHQDKCISKCPSGFAANIDYYCYCSNTANTSLVTVDHQCLPVAFCPIEMGWDSYSSSCLACKFGCISCYDGGCT